MLDKNDTVCVPVFWGTSYIPFRSLYVTDRRWYLLGTASGMRIKWMADNNVEWAGGIQWDIDTKYSPTEVKSPKEWGTKSTWTSTNYAFDQSYKTIDSVDWAVMRPIIADSDGDGAVDATGLWRQGESFLDMPLKLTHDDTSSMTSPADIIAYGLRDFGALGKYLSPDAFSDAKTDYSTWGLTWNGGHWFKELRRKIVSQWLTMCHSGLRIGEGIELYTKSKTSQKTLTKAHILKRRETGPGTFRYRDLGSEDLNDSGHAAYQQSGQPQDRFISISVPAKGTTKDYIASETIQFPFVQDNQEVQKLGTLYYQRKLKKQAEVNFTCTVD